MFLTIDDDFVSDGARKSRVKRKRSAAQDEKKDVPPTAIKSDPPYISVMNQEKNFEYLGRIMVRQYSLQHFLSCFVVVFLFW